MTANAKQSGTLYEQAFILRCMRQGLHPHPSVGDYLPHDMIVQNVAGRMIRVQVKGTDALHRRNTKMGKLGRYRITAMSGNKANNRPIDCQLVDVLSIYVNQHDCFYNIPCTELTSGCIWIAPHNADSRGKYERFKENWDVFK